MLDTTNNSGPVTGGMNMQVLNTTTNNNKGSVVSVADVVRAGKR